MPENPEPTAALREHVDGIDDFCFAAITFPVEPRERAPVRAAVARRRESGDIFEQDPVGMYFGNSAEHACTAFTRIIETLPVPRRRVRLARESCGKDVDFLVMKHTPIDIVEVAEVASLGKFMRKDRAGGRIDLRDRDQLVGDVGKLKCRDITAHAGAQAQHVDRLAIGAASCLMTRCRIDTRAPSRVIAWRRPSLSLCRRVRVFFTHPDYSFCSVPTKPSVVQKA